VKKIFLYGYYGFSNTGDDLLLQSSIESILKVWPRSVFTTRNYKKTSIPEKYDKIVHLTNCDEILEDSKSTKLVRFFRYTARLYSEIKGHELLVFGGGTLWHTNPNVLSLILVFWVILCAKLNGSRVIAIGLGVGPINGIIARLVCRTMILCCEEICVRDTQSMTNLQSTNKKVRKTADLVYGSTFADEIAKTNNLKFARMKEKTIAITLTSHLNSEQYSSVSDALKNSITPFLFESWNLRILIFQDSDAVSDLPFAQYIKSSFPKELQENISFFNVTSSKEDLTTAFENVSLHIGMRFHGAVLASIMRIPFIGISDDHKVSSLAKYFSMPFFATEEASSNLNENIINFALHQKYDESSFTKIENMGRANFDWFREREN
tara:strand:+ start:69210 stop:70346 length:1137 start_codon:yes stop_codon:yes gene_type:complete